MNTRSPMMWNTSSPRRAYTDRRCKASHKRKGSAVAPALCVVEEAEVVIAWLVDTLVMTSVLMAFVLRVRGPVGRWFGLHAAYALWALPMIRLVMPPLVIPRALAPTALWSRLNFGPELMAGAAVGAAPTAVPAAVRGEAEREFARNPWSHRGFQCNLAPSWFHGCFAFIFGCCLRL